MRHGTARAKALFRYGLAAGLALSGLSCGIFEPRTAEAPTQPGLDYQPALDPGSVISNLISAVGQKSETNYIRCFTDPATSPRTFTFIPSAEGLAQYGSIFASWGRNEELNYFRNLHARSTPTAYSDLQLTEKTPPSITPDSVVYYYDYVFQFEHSDKTFPTTAQGSLIFTIVPDNSGEWAICRWVDLQTTSATSWSMFKGKFSS